MTKRQRSFRRYLAMLVIAAMMKKENESEIA
jgi:hypothetical protein